RSGPAASAATTALRGDVELVLHNDARMAGLRVRADVGGRSADEHVEILHVLRPLADEHVASTLALHELERANRAAVHETRIPVGGRHRVRRRGRRTGRRGNAASPTTATAAA